MRADTNNFIQANADLNKEPRYVIEISFDTAHTDLHYFTSNSSAAVPGGASVTHAVVSGISGTTQSLDTLTANSTIGAISFSLLDSGGAVSALFNQKLLVDGNGLRHKRVRIYVGYGDLAWADYTLVQTQIVQEVAYSGKGLEYKIKCNDIQRELREQLFTVKTTYLLESIVAPNDPAWDNLIPIDDDTGFAVVAHGSSYSDAPNSEVLYVRIDDEVIRCTGTTIDPVKGLCFVVDTDGRGALGTYAVAHEVDANQPIERRKKVTEVVYLEMPAIKLAYALITGNLYGQTGKTLPDHWHLGVGAEYIATSEFENIGMDIWDPSNDSNGVPARFVALEEEDGKKFIERELYLLAGVFSPVRTDGQLGLRRLSSVLNGADTVRTLDATTIVSYSDLVHAAKEVRNRYSIAWNYDWFDEKFTRVNALVDANSISKHGEAPVEYLEFRGMYGNVYTVSALAQRFNSLRDRYAGPPLKLQVTTFLYNNFLEVGDVVRVRLPSVRDYSNDDYARLDRAFEIQRVRIDWMKGRVTLDLFGSSEPASLSNDGLIIDTNTVLNDSFYSSAGTELSTVLTITAGHVTANGTLTGGATLDAGIYYYLGDLTIDAGVTVTITDNVQLRIRGTLDVRGTINGRGQGRAGGAQKTTPASITDVNNGTPGIIGFAHSSGGIDGSYTVPSGEVWGACAVPRPDSAFVQGQHVSLPYFSVLNPDGSALEGLPTDLRGCSGSSGCHALDGEFNQWSYGGAGGKSGAGLLVIARGMTTQLNSLIDLSGGDGALGQTQQFSEAAWNITICAGSGGGGGPGAMLVLLDGSLAPSPLLAGAAGEVRVRNVPGLTPTQPNATIPTSYFGGTCASWHAQYPVQNVTFQSNDTEIFLYNVWSASAFYSGVTGAAYWFWGPGFSNVGDLIEYLIAQEYLIQPTVPNGFIYKAINFQSPTTSLIYDGDVKIYMNRFDTGSTEPAWPTTIGATVQDGDITWECTYDVSWSGYGGGSRVQRLPRAETPSEDPVTTSSLPTVSAPAVTQNLPQTLNQNLATIEVAVTPPADPAYAFSNVYYRVQGTDGWTLMGPAQDEATVMVAMDGTSYEFKVTSVSIYGAESEEYETTSVTVPSATGGVTLGNSNFLAYAKTAYSDDANVGFWLGVEAAVAKFNLGGAANNMKWDGSDLVITGIINALAGGDIAGWTINADTIESPNGRIILDSTNQRIRVENLTATNYLELDGNGLRAYDSVLGSTVDIPTDGGAPEFSSGIIREYTFEMYTSGVIKTDSNPAANGGILINPLGIYGYNTSGVLKFSVSAVTGKATLTDAEITGNGNISINSATYGNQGIQLQYNSGTPRAHIGNKNGGGPYLEFDGANLITRTLKTSAGTGKRIELNPNGDNEIHFYGDNGATPGVLEELCTIGNSEVYDNTILNVGTVNSVLKGINVLGRPAIGGLVTIQNYGDNSTALYTRHTANGLPAYFGNTGNAIQNSICVLVDSNGVGDATHTPQGIKIEQDRGYGLYTHTDFPTATYNKGPIRLWPSTSGGIPTHTSDKGTVWVNNYGAAYINYNNAGGWGCVGPFPWVNFNGTGTVAIRDSLFVTSITDNGTGLYTINFSVTLPNANYAIHGIAYYPGVTSGFLGVQSSPFTTTSCKIAAINTSGGLIDASYITCHVAGD